MRRSARLNPSQNREGEESHNSTPRPLPTASAPSRGGGRGRSQSRGERRDSSRAPPLPVETNLVEESERSVTLAPAAEQGGNEVVTAVRDLRNTMETILDFIAQQSARGAAPPVVPPAAEPARRVVEQEPIVMTDSAPRSAGFEVSLGEFMKLKPPKFKGSRVEGDPDEFLDGMRKIFKALKCSSARMVELATFCLERPAQKWIEMVLAGRDKGLPAMEWEEFEKLFIDRYVPQGKKDELAARFEMLTQHPRTSVAEYAEEFTRLSVYAPHLVATEEMGVKRFVRGLVTSMFRSVHPHAENISFAKAVDLAETLEERNLEHRDDRNGGKRQKTTTSMYT